MKRHTKRGWMKSIPCLRYMMARSVLFKNNLGIFCWFFADSNVRQVIQDNDKRLVCKKEKVKTTLPQAS